MRGYKISSGGSGGDFFSRSCPGTRVTTLAPSRSTRRQRRSLKGHSKLLLRTGSHQGLVAANCGRSLVSSLR